VAALIFLERIAFERTARQLVGARAEPAGRPEFAG
jgi:hypothetical protein